MTNLEFLAGSTTALSFKRREAIDNYLIGILSVRVDETGWRNAVKTAIEMEARTNALAESTRQGGSQCA